MAPKDQTSVSAAPKAQKRGKIESLARNIIPRTGRSKEEYENKYSDTKYTNTQLRQKHAKSGEEQLRASASVVGWTGMQAATGGAHEGVVQFTRTATGDIGVVGTLATQRRYSKKEEALDSVLQKRNVPRRDNPRTVVPIIKAASDTVITKVGTNTVIKGFDSWKTATRDVYERNPDAYYSWVGYND